MCVRVCVCARMCVCMCVYCICLINTVSMICTPVQHYLNKKNIEIVLTFISNAPSNSTACHLATPNITANYCVMMVVSSRREEICINLW